MGACGVCSLFQMNPASNDAEPAVLNTCFGSKLCSSVVAHSVRRPVIVGLPGHCGRICSVSVIEHFDTYNSVL